MVVIRLARWGKKKCPFYRIVVADSRAPRNGKHLDVLGFFNPVAKGDSPRLKLDLDMLKEWMGKGAQPSDRVKSLVKEARKQENSAA